MFSQPPDNEQNSSRFIVNNPRRKRQKKLKRKNKQKNQGVKRDIQKKKAPSPVPITMSSWAENFTSAATWQLKNQIAYWKSKAVALEYENKLLHDIIRKNYANASQNETSTMPNSDNEDSDECQSIESENNEPEEAENEEGEDFEVSEEFIQFLRENKKFRDDAKREKERLEKQNNSEQKMIEDMEAGPSEPAENQKEVLKRLYGDNSDKIAALESSFRSQFINFCDREKPMHWPNIPFNFNFG